MKVDATIVPALAARDLTYRLGNRSLLRSIDLSVGRGESVAIMGPSGSGKTTLLNCLAGLIPPDEGDVLVDGVSLTALTSAAKARVRLSKIGMIYQYGELLPELSVVDNVTLPAMLAKCSFDIQARASTVLDDLGLATLRDRPAVDLSGGERQRVSVARALILSPLIVLADEPTGSLDAKGAASIADMLFALPGECDCALVVVTHNDEIAKRSDTVMTLSSGRMVAAA